LSLSACPWVFLLVPCIILPVVKHFCPSLNLPARPRALLLVLDSSCCYFFHPCRPDLPAHLCAILCILKPFCSPWVFLLVPCSSLLVSEPICSSSSLPCSFLNRPACHSAFSWRHLMLILTPSCSSFKSSYSSVQLLEFSGITSSLLVYSF
jgi:hypothetical protein